MSLHCKACDNFIDHKMPERAEFCLECSAIIDLLVFDETEITREVLIGLYEDISQQEFEDGEEDELLCQY